MGPEGEAGAFSGFHPAVKAWFEQALGQPTPTQELGWPPIARGENTLILAPTGSGKTLAAFLHCLNRLYLRAGSGEDGGAKGVRVLYVSPLRALNNDIHRNLEVPLEGIGRVAGRLGRPLPVLASAVRTGDTPPEERRRMLRHPPHILITTPESLSLLLCSKAREVLRTVETAIVDEIHALFPNKRGTQLSLALEQLQDLAGQAVQRIGLSATQRPLEEIAAFLGGGERQGKAWCPRPVTVVEAGGCRPLDLKVTLPVRDFRELPENSVWPEIHRTVLELVQQHRSTLVFVNSRQVGERVAAAINDLSGEELCQVHHGSISREARLETERRLKAGELRCLVATSSLELGIDIGAIDLVIQVESPHEVARGLQRVGRAAHVPGLPSKGRILPKTRQDLLEAAVLAREMLAGRIESHHAQDNALDVLAQFLVGATTGAVRTAGDLYTLVSRSYNYRALPRAEFEGVLDMLSGAFDTGEYLGLRPLVYWDRLSGTVAATERGRRLVFSSGGTIPDAGQFNVVLEGAGVRLGELDEEFVYERRLGDRFTLGTSAWKIVEFKHDSVVVQPASGGPRAPFWKGEALGRSCVLGRAMGALLGEADEALSREASSARRSPDRFWGELASEAALDQDGVDNLREYLVSQRAATGYLPSGQRLLTEEFRDETGQWRVVLHSLLGRRVNEPLAMLLTADFERRLGRVPDVVVTDDGIMLGWTASEQPPPLDLARLAGPDLLSRVARLLRATPLFGLLFRQAAGRALVLPRVPYGRRRRPLWLSRRKASGLLALVERSGDFPLITEAYREGLSNVFDLQGLSELLEGLASGAVEIVRVRREVPSPFARPLIFAATGAFLYANDLPAAERRVRYLGLDPESLAELLGRAPLRELLDPAAIAETTFRAGPAGLVARPPEGIDELHLWMLRYGELAPEDVPAEVEPQLRALQAAGRVQLVRWPAGGEARQVWIASEDAPTYARALPQRPGSAGDPEAVGELMSRFGRRNTPFTARQAADWYGLPEGPVLETLRRLAARGLMRPGAFAPGGRGEEWADPLLLEEMHRRSLARARRAIEPAPAAQFARFLTDWQGVRRPPAAGLQGASAGGRVPRRGRVTVADVLSQLAGRYLSAQSWESTVLPLRVGDYAPAHLDALLSTGRFRWLGAGTAGDLKVSFWPADRASGVGDGASGALSPAARRVLEVLHARGALFLNDLWQSSPARPGEILAALEELLAAGEVTNDTFGPVRHLLSLGPHYRSLPRQVTPAVLGSMGRWSATGGRPPVSPEQACDLLLARYGFISREIAAADGMPWGDLLSTLARREILGEVRRGYFVRGLGGLQYALPAAVEALRDAAPEGQGNVVALPDGDPALAWGRILEWPAGAGRLRQPLILATVDGRPALAAEGRPLRVRRLAQLEGQELAAALSEAMDVAALALAAAGRIEVAAFDERPVLGGPAEKLLEDIGFTRGPQAMVRWLGGLDPTAG